MKKILFVLSMLSVFAFASCDKVDNQEELASIVGEWSMGRGEWRPDGTNDVAMHLSIKADGTYALTMPAWDETRSGSYVIKDDVITLTCNKLEWVLPRDNGYRNVYEQYLDYEYTQAPTPPTFEDWAEHWQDEVVKDVKFFLDTDGLHLDGLSGMSPEEVWVIDTKFDAEAECRKHMIY